MAKQAKRGSRYGEYWANFDALQTLDDFLSVSRGEKSFESQHGYPILEMLRVAKLSMDQRRKLVKPGKLQALEAEITGASISPNLLKLPTALKAKSCTICSRRAKLPKPCTRYGTRGEALFTIQR